MYKYVVSENIIVILLLLFYVCMDGLIFSPIKYSWSVFVRNFFMWNILFSALISLRSLMIFFIDDINVFFYSMFVWYNIKKIHFLKTIRPISNYHKNSKFVPLNLQNCKSSQHPENLQNWAAYEKNSIKFTIRCHYPHFLYHFFRHTIPRKGIKYTNIYSNDYYFLI
jgi:hypothetical protein